MDKVDDHGVDSSDDGHLDIIGSDVDHRDHHNDDHDDEVKGVNGS